MIRKIFTTKFFLLFILIAAIVFYFKESDFVFAAAPSVTTGSASSITKTSAFVSGSLVSNGGQDVTSAGFHYGTTSSYGNTTPGNLIYTQVSQIGTAGSSDGQINAPRRVVLDSVGNIYIVDSV